MCSSFKILIFLIILNRIASQEQTEDRLLQELENPGITDYAKYLAWCSIKPKDLQINGKPATKWEMHTYKTSIGFGVIISNNLILAAPGDAPPGPRVEFKSRTLEGRDIHVKGVVETIVGYGQTRFNVVPGVPYQMPLKIGTKHTDPKGFMTLYETKNSLELNTGRALISPLASKLYMSSHRCLLVKPTEVQQVPHEGSEIVQYPVEILDFEKCRNFTEDIHEDAEELLMCFNISNCAVNDSGLPVFCNDELASVITEVRRTCDTPLVGANIFNNLDWINYMITVLAIDGASSTLIFRSAFIVVVLSYVI